MTSQPALRPEEAAPGARPSFGLAELVSPIGRSRFATEYWERRHLVVHRHDPDYYRDLLSLEDLDRILSLSSFRSADTRIVADSRGEPIHNFFAAEGGPSNILEVVYAKYRAGATINLAFLNERWEPLKRLCQSLASEISGMVQTNIYLTPGGEVQGLTPHFDTHDVFVVQVYGTKHWCLYDSKIELPVKWQSFRSSTDQQVGDPVEEFDLETGDVLYMPRGTVHGAVSKPNVASCHVTIGIHSVVWGDLIRNAVDDAVAQDVELRRGLPLGFATDDAARDALREQAAALVDRLTAELRPEELVSDGVQRAWIGRQTVLEGHLLDLEGLSTLTLDTPVRRRTGLVYRIRRGATHLGVQFHGKVVKLPDALADEVAFVAQGRSFTGRDIPGDLDDESRLVLLRTLVREGFLTMDRWSTSGS